MHSKSFPPVLPSELIAREQEAIQMGRQMYMRTGSRYGSGYSSLGGYSSSSGLGGSSSTSSSGYGSQGSGYASGSGGYGSQAAGSYGGSVS